MASPIEKINAIPIHTLWDMLQDKFNLPDHLDGNSNITCPFHEDNEPSARVGGGNFNTFKCFSCGVTANGFDLIMRLLGTDSAKEALDWAKANLTIGVEATRKRKPVKSNKKKKLYTIEKARKFVRVWNALLLKKQEHIEWFEKNYGINRETLKSCKIGVLNYPKLGIGYTYPAGYNGEIAMVSYKTQKRYPGKKTPEKTKRQKRFVAGFPVVYMLKNDMKRVCISSGEEKALAAYQMGYTAISSMTGENGNINKIVDILKKDFNHENVSVYLANDNDIWGAKSNKAIIQELKAKGYKGVLYLIEWDKDDKKGFDVNDLLLSGRWEETFNNAKKITAKTIPVDMLYNERGRLIQFLAAELFKAQHPHIYNVGGFWHEYDDGYYKQIQREIVKKYIHEMLKERCETSDVDNLFRFLEVSLYKSVDIWENNYINCENGFIDINEMNFDNVEINLRPHTPDRFFRNKISVPYMPNEDAPLFRKTIMQIIPEPDVIFMIQQFFGYCLTPDTSLQKAMIWLGRGANGKGLLSSLLEGILGESQVSHLRLAQIENDRMVGRLDGKLLNVASESKANSDGSEDLLKQLIHADDRITCNPKWVQPYDFKTVAKWLLCLNEPLRSADTSHGFWRSFIVVRFNQKFWDPGDIDKPEKALLRDNKLYDKLLSELPGILNWAIGGMIFLKKNKGFEVPKTCQRWHKDMRYESNSVLRFSNEECEVNPFAKSLKTELYRAYKKFCFLEGSRAKSRTRFYYELSELYPGINIHARTSKERYVEGIKVIDDRLNEPTYGEKLDDDEDY